VSVRRHILELLGEIQRTQDIAYVLVSHDFHAVRTLADDVTVLLHGAVVETGTAAKVLSAPEATYTQKLIGSELAIGPRTDTAGIETITTAEIREVRG